MGPPVLFLAGRPPFPAHFPPLTTSRAERNLVRGWASLIVDV